jgi:hypothetical protein
LELATGQHIALLHHDDTLAPDAIQYVAHQITTQPELDMIYTDEDILLDGRQVCVDGRQVWVHLKPGWSPDTLRTNGYTCHLGATGERWSARSADFAPSSTVPRTST